MLADNDGTVRAVAHLEMAMQARGKASMVQKIPHAFVVPSLFSRFAAWLV